MNLPLDIYPLIFLRIDSSLWKVFLILEKRITAKILESKSLWEVMCLKYFDEPERLDLSYFKSAWIYGIWINILPNHNSMKFDFYIKNRKIIRSMSLGEKMIVDSTRKIVENANRRSSFDYCIKSSFKLDMKQWKNFSIICDIVAEIFNPEILTNITDINMILMRCKPSVTLYQKKGFKMSNKKTVSLVRMNYNELECDHMSKFKIEWAYSDGKITNVNYRVNEMWWERCTLVPNNIDPVGIF